MVDLLALPTAVPDQVGTASGAAPVPSRPAERGLLTRRAVAGAGLVLVLVGLATATPFAVLVGCVLAGASVVLPWLALDAALVAGSLGWLLLATTGGLAATWLGTDLLASPSRVAATLAVLATGAAVLAAADLPHGRAVRRSSPWVVIAYVPAMLATAIAVVQAVTSRTAASWAFLGTDLVNHMQMVHDIQVSGALDYATNGYPRGLHTLWALASAPALAGQDPRSLLELDLRLVASGTWLSFALVLLAAASMTVRLGRLLGTGSVTTVTAAVLASGGMLACNPFVDSFVFMAAAPSLLALVVMWAVPWAALDLQGHRRRGPALVVVAGVATVLLAHLWQALALVPLVELAATVPVVRLARRQVPWRTTVRTVLWAGAVAIPVAVLSLPAMVGILHTRGLAQAAVPGSIPLAPVPVTLLALLSLVRMIPVIGRAGTRAYLAAGVGLAAVVAVLLAGSGTMDLQQYYPGKGVWFLTVMFVPVLVLATVEVAAWLVTTVGALTQRLGRAARVTRAGLVCLLVAAAGAFLLPIPVVDGFLALDAVRFRDANDLSGLRYDIALDYATRFRPARTVPIEVGVGSVPDPTSTLLVSRLISFETGQPVRTGVPRFVCQDIRTVAGSGPAVVLTSLDPSLLEAVMRQGGCGDVPVVRRSGPPRQLSVPLVPPGTSVVPG